MRPVDPEIVAFERRYVARAQAALSESGPFDHVVLDRGAPGATGIAGWWCPPDAGPGVLPNPWDDREAVGLYDRFVWATMERVTGHLGMALNEAHGVELPASYWEWMLAPWLNLVVAVVADRRLFCLAAAEVAPGAPTTAAPGLPAPAPTFMDAISGMRSDAWNRAVIGHLARGLGIPTTDEPAREQAVPGHRPQPSLVRLLPVALGAPGQAADIAARALLSRVPRRRLAVVGLIKLSPGQLLQLAARVRGLRTAPKGIRRLPEAWSHGPVDAEHPARAALAQLEADHDLERAVVSLLPALLPTSVLELYGDMVRESRRVFGAPSHVLHGNYGFAELENEFLARCDMAGRRVVFTQHGGATLQLEAAGAERFEQRPGTLRIVWGGRDDNAIAAPSPYLARLRDRHRGGESVLVVEAVAPPDSYPLRFATTPLGNQTYDAVKMLASFVEASGTARPHFVLKPFPGATDAVRPQAIAALPRPRGAAVRNAAFFMRTARLSVVAYPDTPFLEAMVMGGPVIGLWDTSKWNMLPDAAEHFDELERLGVVHGDPGTAAALVDDVYARADAWWASPEIRAAREAFIERFAMDGDWLAEWSRILNGLTD